MTTNLQNSPYLPRQRNFPNEDAQKLGVELDKAYIDIASRVNERTIGLFSKNLPSITGERWFLAGQPNRQQTLRQVYESRNTAVIPHGINFSQIDRITRMYGVYTDNINTGNEYGLIAASNVPIAGQVTFYLDSTNIVILVGAGAPAVDRLTIVIEWLSDF